MHIFAKNQKFTLMLYLILIWLVSTAICWITFGLTVEFAGSSLNWAERLDDLTTEYPYLLRLLFWTPGLNSLVVLALICRFIKWCICALFQKDNWKSVLLGFKAILNKK